jgi:uncharacterized protein
LLPEPGADESRDIYLAATRIFSSRLLVPEVSAALARARRTGRLSARSATAARRLGHALLEEVVPVDVDERLADRAWDLAGAYALRGYDAVHLASFERVEAGESILVAADGALARAARGLGHAVAVPG